LAVPPTRLVFFFVLLRVAIAAMTVLSVHKRLRPSVLTDCQLKIGPLLLLHALAAREKPHKTRAENRRPPQTPPCATG
jgi:hypothetical protein